MPQIFTIWLLPTPFQTLKPNLGNQLMNSKGLWRTRAVLQSQACLPGLAHVSSWGSPFKSRHWDESLCTSGFLRNSPRGKKKKAVASSRKQERKGKEAKQMRDFRPNPKLSLSLLIAQSCPALCNPMDCSPPGSSVHGILQTRKLEWVAIFFSKGSPYPGIEPGFPAL